MIEVVPYNPNWPEMFEKEALLIKRALGDNCITIHHIGSTSIPGISAKPIIDILPVVKNIQDVDAASKEMEKLGYEVKGEYGIAFRRHFQKGDAIKTHNVHVFQKEDPEIARHIKFRNWLRTHPDDAEAYDKLKRELASQFRNDTLSYYTGKDAFIASIDMKDGYEGWRMLQVFTPREQEKARKLRQQCSNSLPLEKEDHIHFIFFSNSKMIGYADLKLCPKPEAIISLITIEKPYRNQGHGSRFLQLCERWLDHQGYANLFLNCPKDTCPFFSKNGYTEMASDPNGSAMSKTLK